MWGWGIANVEDADNVHIEQTIQEFIDHVSSFNSTCYFHNLKFDGKFILDWLLKNGYKHVTGHTHQMLRGEFKTLISEMRTFYSITVRWNNGKTTEFRDSLKKVPIPVERIGETYGFELTKGEIDYKLARPLGYVITPEERDYIRRDVSIVAKALKIALDAGMTRLTVASDSLSEYKRIVGSKGFTRVFPVFSEHMDAEIRRAYRGGFTYASPRFKGRKLGCGLVLDVNSLYPAVMYNEELPFGDPEWQDGKVEPTESHPLTVFSVTFTAKLKPDHIPCIQIKGSSAFVATEYLSEITEPTTLMVTSVDFALYQDHYDIDVLEYGGGWRFHATKGLFADYIDKWSKIKENSTGGLREIAKLHLNSLYGKFATNPNVTSMIPYLKDGVVHYARGEDERIEPVYTAVGVFITSYARNLTIRAAQANYDTFAYADTDSLHLVMDTTHLFNKDPKTVTAEDVGVNLPIDPHKMGSWKFEYAFDAAFYARAKVYFNRKPDGKFKNAIAGLPVRISKTLTFDHIIDNASFAGKLKPRSVPGGVVLEDVDWRLKLDVC